MELFIKGKISGIKRNEDKNGNVTGYQLQFLTEREDGSLDLQQVKLPVDLYKNEIAKGKEITANVTANIFNNKIYYKIAKVISVK